MTPFCKEKLTSPWSLHNSILKLFPFPDKKKMESNHKKFINLQNINIWEELSKSDSSVSEAWLPTIFRIILSIILTCFEGFLTEMMPSGKLQRKHGTHIWLWAKVRFNSTSTGCPMLKYSCNLCPSVPSVWNWTFQVFPIFMQSILNKHFWTGTVITRWT